MFSSLRKRNARASDTAKHKLAGPGKMAANSTVAVVYSGHLGVVVPEAGALARRFLVDPLRASVFVAGQHAASVTGGHNWVGASAHACPGLPALWPASTRLC